MRVLEQIKESGKKKKPCSLKAFKTRRDPLFDKNIRKVGLIQVLINSIFSTLKQNKHLYPPEKDKLILGLQNKLILDTCTIRFLIWIKEEEI